MSIETFVKDNKTYAFLPATNSGMASRLLDEAAIDMEIEREVKSAEAIAAQKAQRIADLRDVKTRVAAANSPK